MVILLVGSGGREHALAWKIIQSPLVTRLVCAPGNPGIEAVCDTSPVAAEDVAGQVALAAEIGADLVVIGPESAIAAGLADRLAEIGVACFGPSAAAGRLETSKAFAKGFAARHGLPSAPYLVFDDAASAKMGLGSFSAPYVLKADGLAAGKGVVIAPDRDTADREIDGMFAGRFGSAGSRLVIEAFLEGEIASVFALCDGEIVMMFGGAQDHKRAMDGDVGPNTGGMGAYAPAPVLSLQMLERVEAELIRPALRAIAAEGAPYRGVLFCEVMVTADGPKLIEFNARFGDPECQVLMLRLESDIVPYLDAVARGRLSTLPPPAWRADAAICVVMAAEGYPEAPKLGAPIELPPLRPEGNVMVFQAGAKRDAAGVLRASGGRVLSVCARALSLRDAAGAAYQAVTSIHFPGSFHRSDIGWRGLAAERALASSPGPR